MFAQGGGWGIPISLHPTYVTLGGIEEKPIARNGEIVIRKVLSVTASFNHDLIDGAPATRFTKTFKKLVENGYQLFDLLPQKKISEK
jgi:pyruvate/2-oxoglutarate dehydrogenase complex dihydrolipoamide acyltransferase (E2) component